MKKAKKVMIGARVHPTHKKQIQTLANKAGHGNVSRYVSDLIVRHLQRMK